jgi:hypothetical protein
MILGHRALKLGYMKKNPFQIDREEHVYDFFKTHKLYLIQKSQKLKRRNDKNILLKILKKNRKP